MVLLNNCSKHTKRYSGFRRRERYSVHRSYIAISLCSGTLIAGVKRTGGHVWQLDLNTTVVHPVWHTTQDPCEAVAEMSMLSRNRGYLLARAVTAVQDASVWYLVLCVLSAIKNHQSTNEIRLELTKNVKCVTALSNPPSMLFSVKLLYH